VLFDVDGTLIDTNYLHTVAWSQALADAGEWAPMNAIHRLVGMGGDQLVPRLLGHVSPQALDARTRRYRELIDEAKPFPGATALLRRTHEAGLVVALATSSPGDELQVLRALLEADDVIDAQTTADEIKASKPDPEVFLAAMGVAGIDPAWAVAVGDSVWDVEAARGAGIACIGVESGGFSRHELSEAGAVQVFRDVQELGRQFQTSPLAVLARSIS
jgi:HAD superfamily hydrolase (TIGR01509 family)